MKAVQEHEREQTTGNENERVLAIIGPYHAFTHLQVESTLHSKFHRRLPSERRRERVKTHSETPTGNKR